MIAADVAEIRQTNAHGAQAGALDPDRVRPADAGEGADIAWRRFCNRIAYGLDFLREHNPIVRSLERGPWAIIAGAGPALAGQTYGVSER
jgi:hypothetical protein